MGYVVIIDQYKIPQKLTNIMKLNVAPDDILLGVNLLVGTDNGLSLLDRSGNGKVFPLISRRRFQQIDVMEGQNILVSISGTPLTKLTYL